jgi:hypothetical protein
MTEEAWLDDNSHPQRMVFHLSNCGFARSKVGRRKLRLFACACCRVIWDVIPHEDLRKAVLVAERFSDGHASKEELSTARAKVEDMQGVHGSFGDGPAAVWVAITMCVEAANPRPFAAAFMMTATGEPLAGKMPARQAEARLSDLLRDVFGNPFRPITLNPSWLTSTVLTLARQMYDSRDFSPMPILADALQDAGCDNEDILNHCRQPGEHVRGCWCVDHLIGRG